MSFPTSWTGQTTTAKGKSIATELEENVSNLQANGLRNCKRQETLQEHLAKPRGDLRKHAGLTNRLELGKNIAAGSLQVDKRAQTHP